MAQALHGKLHVRHAELRAALARVQLQSPVRVRAGHRAKPADISDIKLFCLPGLQSPGDLFGKALGIGGRAERLPSENARGLMMAVSVPRGSRKACDQHIGTKRS